MGKLIALAAFGIAFAIFVALKYISKHARKGVIAAHAALDAIEDGGRGGLHAHYHKHGHDSDEDED